jgi:serine/threonine-protein kinase
LPLAFHALGRRSEADAALAALKGKFADVAAFQIAEVHAFRGEVDLAFEWLERAYDQRDGGLSDIKFDRLLQRLVGDPRYKAFLRKLTPGSVKRRLVRRCARHATYADSVFAASAIA